MQGRRFGNASQMVEVGQIVKVGMGVTGKTRGGRVRRYPGCDEKKFYSVASGAGSDSLTPGSRRDGKHRSHLSSFFFSKAEFSVVSSFPKHNFLQCTVCELVAPNQSDLKRADCFACSPNNAPLYRGFEVEGNSCSPNGFCMCVSLYLSTTQGYNVICH